MLRQIFVLLYLGGTRWTNAADPADPVSHTQTNWHYLEKREDSDGAVIDSLKGFVEPEPGLYLENDEGRRMEIIDVPGNLRYLGNGDFGKLPHKKFDELKGGSDKTGTFKKMKDFKNWVQLNSKKEGQLWLRHTVLVNDVPRDFSWESKTGKLRYSKPRTVNPHSAANAAAS